MARIRVPLNNFSFGEVSPSLTSRTDSQVYQNAAEKVTNFFIRSEGGVIKRPGSKFIHKFSDTYDSSLTQQIRIEPFVFSDDEKYIIALRNGNIDAFFINPTTGAVSLSATVAFSEITSARIPQITFAQSGDFMFFCHSDFFPVILKRTALDTFVREQFAFDTSLDGNKTYQPYYNFQATGVTITPSHTSGTGRTFTTSADYFNSAMVGTRLLIGETEVVLTAVTDAQNATGNIKGTIRKQLDIDAIKTKKDLDEIEIIHVNHGLAAGASITIANSGGVGGISASNINGAQTIARVIDENRYEVATGHNANSEDIGGGSVTIESTAATTEWYEQSYSTYRGFPSAITFHENRLWFGGTDSQPDGIWGSKTAEYFNFDVGKGEDTDSIDFDAAAGVTNRIRHLVSNRDLQVFASQGEFFVPSSTTQPLTPANAKISAQTPFGTGFVRPQSIDGATLFVQSTGTAVREYVFADSEGAYVGGQVSLLSSHLISNPKQLAVVKGSLNRSGAYGFFLNGDGNISVFYHIRNEKKLGWMNWTTNGNYVSVGSTDNNLFAVVSRDQGDGTTKLYLEQFDTDFQLDCSKDYTGTAGVFDVSTVFANGASVDVVEGTEYLGAFTVAGGNADVSAVDATSTSAEIGYKFTPELKTLPIDAGVQGGPLTARPRRLSLVDLDLNDTLSVSVNGTDMIIRNVNFDPSQPRVKQTGKEEFRPLGFSKDPRVTISQSAPLDLQINGMVIEVAF
tara:strand:- start:1206 stop:3419 length:2214 start_codon:yes stop_codon:yes gene_type:complete